KMTNCQVNTISTQTFLCKIGIHSVNPIFRLISGMSKLHLRNKNTEGYNYVEHSPEGQTSEYIQGGQYFFTSKKTQIEFGRQHDINFSVKFGFTPSASLH
ncbi:MAG: hypothetical protein JXR49_05100, partial [Acidobacteria bacterium]|nr:hypothetical protein [Acidobacteriota bacterium]